MKYVSCMPGGSEALYTAYQECRSHLQGSPDVYQFAYCLQCNSKVHLGWPVSLEAQECCAVHVLWSVFVPPFELESMVHGHVPSSPCQFQGFGQEGKSILGRLMQGWVGCIGEGSGTAVWGRGRWGRGPWVNQSGEGVGPVWVTEARFKPLSLALSALPCQTAHSCISNFADTAPISSFGLVSATSSKGNKFQAASLPISVWVVIGLALGKTQLTWASP